MRDYLFIEIMLPIIGSQRLQMRPKLLLRKLIPSKAFHPQLERNQPTQTNFSNDSVLYETN